MTPRRLGLTLVEVLVAITILAVVSVAVVGLLPFATRNTQDSRLDAVQSRQATSIFERVASAWSNQTPYSSETVDGETVSNVVSNVMGGACSSTVTSPDAVRKRLIITCTRDGSLPDLELRAEFGDPGA